MPEAVRAAPRFRAVVVLPTLCEASHKERCTLYKRLEAEEAKFKGTTYKGIFDDTTFLFNKIGARHWVEKDRIASKIFMTMDHEELELWYDRAYDMFLSCMVISHYLAIKKDIEAIRRTE